MPSVSSPVSSSRRKFSRTALARSVAPLRDNARPWSWRNRTSFGQIPKPALTTSYARSGSPCARTRSPRQRKTAGEPDPSSCARARQIDINSPSEAELIERRTLSILAASASPRPDVSCATSKSYIESSFCGKMTFFSGNLLALISAGAVVGFVAYFAVTSKINPTSTRKEATPAPQLSASITPESSPLPSATVATNSPSSASEPTLVQQPTPAASEGTAPSTSPDQTPMPSPSPEITTTPPAP